MTEKREKYDAGDESPEQQNTIASEPTFTEAPASVNFRFDWKGWNVQLTIRDEKVNTALKKMEAAIGHLEGMGAKPLSRRGNNGGGGNGGNGSNGDDHPDTKVCPIHHAPMKKREKDGQVWYSHKAVNPDTNAEYWCKGIAK